MPLNLVFITPDNFAITDDGVFGNNTSVIRNGAGAVIFTFLHPADSLSFTASTANVNLALDFDEALAPADFRVGDLTNPAATLNALALQRVVATNVILAANQDITEAGSDFGVDIAGSSLVLSAVSGVGTAANALETQIGGLEAETTMGGINLVNVGAVQIGGMSDQVSRLLVGDSGNLSLVNFGKILLGESDLDLVNPRAQVRGVSGDVSLTANGFDADGSNSTASAFAAPEQVRQNRSCMPSAATP